MKNQFAEMYDAHADAIYRHCYFRVFRKARAEELVQETFMKTWQYLMDGHTIDNPRAFLYRTATNLIIDDSRKKKEASLDEMLEGETQWEPSGDGHKDIEHEVLLREVLDEIKKLDPADREIITMRYVDEMGPAEIGEILGVSANNVSVRLNRAMTALKELMTNDL